MQTMRRDRALLSAGRWVYSAVSVSRVLQQVHGTWPISISIGLDWPPAYFIAGAQGPFKLAIYRIMHNTYKAQSGLGG
jgi:hypothetical protein